MMAGSEMELGGCGRRCPWRVWTTERLPRQSDQSGPAPGDLSDMTNWPPASVQDLEVGTGEEAVDGEAVTVHYTGWFLDGEKFDSSVDRGSTLRLRPFRGG